MAERDVTDASGVRRGTGKETGQGFCQVWLSWVVAPREGLGNLSPSHFLLSLGRAARAGPAGQRTRARSWEPTDGVN